MPGTADKLIFLDMDGVLCDFLGAALAAFGMTFDPKTYPRGLWECWEHIGVSKGEFWNVIDGIGESFWENLDPYPWTRQLVSELKKCGTVVISTAPSTCPTSYSGKRMWLQRMRMGHMDSMFGVKKHLMAREGRILIDDGHHNIDAWEQHGGTAITFPQPWNYAEPVDDLVDHIVRKVRA
jgi:5'(3')-deoxyribonucleotidase